jgi:hypothetical protein
MSFMDSIGAQLSDACSHAQFDAGSFDLGDIGDLVGDVGDLVGDVGNLVGDVGDLLVDAAVDVGVTALTVAAGPLGKIAGEVVGEAIKQIDFGDILGGGDSKTIGEMDQKEFFDAMKDVIGQLARDGQKETRKKGGEGSGEAGASGEAGGAGASEAGGGGSSLRDLAEALGKAVSDRVAAAKDKVSALTADSDQGQILEATSEVGAAGFLATSAGGAMQSAIQGTNELARKG